MNTPAPLARAAAWLSGRGRYDPGHPKGAIVAVTAWADGGMLTIRTPDGRPEVHGASHPAADQGIVTAQLDAGQMSVLAGLIGAEQVAAYVRVCLAAARPERDWFRQAVAKLEAASERIVQSEQPGKDGGTWLVLDWQTGQTLASIEGGQDAYDAAWQDGWTDVSWIGRWLEDLATDGTPALNWPEALPPPPDVAQLTAAPPPLALPGLPASLRVQLEEIIDTWAVTVGGTEGRAAEVAQLTGWTEGQVLACAGSYLAMTGEQFMRIGAEGQGQG